MAEGSSSNDELLPVWRDLVAYVDGVNGAILTEVATRTPVAANWFPVVTMLLNAQDGRLPMNVLSASLSMTSGGFTKLADRIEDAGLIERVPSDQDRRVVYAVLTELGLDTGRQALQIVDEQLRARVVPNASVADLAQLRDQLYRPLSRDGASHNGRERVR